MRYILALWLVAVPALAEGQITVPIIEGTGVTTPGASSVSGLYNGEITATYTVGNVDGGGSIEFGLCSVDPLNPSHSISCATGPAITVAMADAGSVTLTNPQSASVVVSWAIDGGFYAPVWLSVTGIIGAASQGACALDGQCAPGLIVDGGVTAFTGHFDSGVFGNQDYSANSNSPTLTVYGTLAVQDWTGGINPPSVIRMGGLDSGIEFEYDPNLAVPGFATPNASLWVEGNYLATNNFLVVGPTLPSSLWLASNTNIDSGYLYYPDQITSDSSGNIIVSVDGGNSFAIYTTGDLGTHGQLMFFIQDGGVTTAWVDAGQVAFAGEFCTASGCVSNFSSIGNSNQWLQDSALDYTPIDAGIGITVAAVDGGIRVWAVNVDATNMATTNFNSAGGAFSANVTVMGSLYDATNIFDDGGLYVAQTIQGDAGLTITGNGTFGGTVAATFVDAGLASGAGLVAANTLCVGSPATSCVQSFSSITGFSFWQQDADRTYSPVDAGAGIDVPAVDAGGGVIFGATITAGTSLTSPSGTFSTEAASALLDAGLASGAGVVAGNTYCIGTPATSCITSWPSGGSSQLWQQDADQTYSPVDAGVGIDVPAVDAGNEVWAQKLQGNLTLSDGGEFAGLNVENDAGIGGNLNVLGEHSTIGGASSPTLSIGNVSASTAEIEFGSAGTLLWSSSSFLFNQALTTDGNLETGASGYLLIGSGNAEPFGIIFAQGPSSVYSHALTLTGNQNGFISTWPFGGKNQGDWFTSIGNGGEIGFYNDGGMLVNAINFNGAVWLDAGGQVTAPAIDAGLVVAINGVNTADGGIYIASPCNSSSSATCVGLEINTPTPAAGLAFYIAGAGGQQVFSILADGGATSANGPILGTAGVSTLAAIDGGATAAGAWSVSNGHPLSYAHVIGSVPVATSSTVASNFGYTFAQNPYCVCSFATALASAHALACIAASTTQIDIADLTYVAGTEIVTYSCDGQ